MRSLHPRSIASAARVLAMLLLLCVAMATRPPTAQSTDSATAAEHRQPGRAVKIAVVQAGERHRRRGNPRFEANFGRLAELARGAAKERPDRIMFPEFAISGWPYPPGESIDMLAEAIPGDGPGYQRYVNLAKTSQTPLLGWAVERSDGKLYDTSFLLDRTGKFVGKYRKVHANLGEQTW